MTDLAAARALLDSRAADELIAELCGAGPGEVSWDVQSWHVRPGADVTAIYRAQIVDGSTEYPVISTAAPVGARTGRVADLEVSCWLHPDDPGLPGLRSACLPATVARWLGWRSSAVTLRSYRPLRRAVLAATRGQRGAFIKVVPPARTSALVSRHTMLAGLGPEVLGEPEPGVLLLSRVPGKALSSVLADRTNVPGGADLVALLERLPEDALTLRRRPAWSDRLDFYSAGAREQLPDDAPLDDAVDLLRPLLADAPVGPVVPTHGDFYEANIFCCGGVPTHLIDLDSLGPGHLVDDLACLLGHAAVLPGLSPAHYSGIGEITAGWLDHFDSVVDPVALRARTAGVILSLVVGATPTQASGRFDLVREWIGAARRAEAAKLR